MWALHVLQKNKQNKTKQNKTNKQTNKQTNMCYGIAKIPTLVKESYLQTPLPHTQNAEKFKKNSFEKLEWNTSHIIGCPLC